MNRESEKNENPRAEELKRLEQVDKRTRRFFRELRKQKGHERRGR